MPFSCNVCNLNGKLYRSKSQDAIFVHISRKHPIEYKQCTVTKKRREKLQPLYTFNDVLGNNNKNFNMVHAHQNSYKPNSLHRQFKQIHPAGSNPKIKSIPKTNAVPPIFDSLRIYNESETNDDENENITHDNPNPSFDKEVNYTFIHPTTDNNIDRDNSDFTPKIKQILDNNDDDSDIEILDSFIKQDGFIITNNINILSTYTWNHFFFSSVERANLVVFASHLVFDV